MLALGRRAAEIKDDLRFLLRADDAGYVYFLETRGARRVPARLADRRLVDHPRPAARPHGRDGADLGDAHRRRRVRLRAKAGSASGAPTELKLDSEFDYARQAILYLPKSMPDPRPPEFVAAAAREIVDILKLTSGRAFVLFTSYANLREVHRLAAAELEYPILVQGSAPRSALLRDFKATPHAVLLATSSFWQGVDVVGDALELRHHRQAAVRLARRSDHRGADRGDRRARRVGVRRVSDSAGHPGAQAGARAAAAASAGSRRARRARSAAEDDGLRTAVPRVAAAGAGDARSRDIARFFGAMPDDESMKPTVSTTVLMALTRRRRHDREVRPILKWAGGKRQLLPTLRRYYPAAFSRYVEPFLGSGAVFLDCHNQGCSTVGEVRLSDINADVIGCYRMVRDDVEASSRRCATSRRASPRTARGISTPSATSSSTRCGETSSLGRSGAGLHAGARGDADLPESHRLQRAVPAELARRLQRAGRPLCQGHDLRCGQPQTAVGGAAPAGPELEVSAVRGGAGDGTAGRFRLSRSALCAGQPNGAVHVLHRRQVRPGRAGAAAAGGGQARAAGARFCSAIRSRPTSAGSTPTTARHGRRAQGTEGSGAPGHQLRASRRGAVREYLITNIV